MNDLQMAGDFRAAAEYLRAHGWDQFAYEHEGAVCMVGAILAVTGRLGDAYWNIGDGVALALGMELEGAGDGEGAIIRWNDDVPDQTAEKVIDRFESTALALEIRALASCAAEAQPTEQPELVGMA